VTEAEERQLVEAVRILGHEVTKRIVLEALVEAADRKRHGKSRSAKAGV